MNKQAGIFLLTALLALLTGCSFNQLLPSRRLQKGEVVRSISVTEPGFLYIPRLSYAETRGTGAGDWSAYLTGTAGIIGGGLAARHYLKGSRRNLGVLMGYHRSFFEEDLWGQKLAVNYLTIMPSAGVSPEEGQKFFGRCYGVGMWALERNGKGERVWLVGGGFAAGADFLKKNGHSLVLGLNVTALCSRSGCGVLPALSLGYIFRKRVGR